MQTLGEIEFRPGDFLVYENVSHDNTLFVRSREGRWWRIFNADENQPKVDDSYVRAVLGVPDGGMLIRRGKVIYNAEV